MNVDPTDLIWMNGEFVAWEDAKVHVLTHGLHYGTGVFEGVRCYDTELGPAVFRNAEHVERLFRSAELYYMDVPYSAEQLRAATLELVARNGLRSCYIRPIVYRGYGPMGLNPLDARVDVTIACWEWGAYLGEEGKSNGVRAKVSSWRRISPDSLIPHAKASGQYLNSVLAKVESVKAGYEEAILLDDHGYVCEGTGENIYIVRDGEIATPGQQQLDPRRHHAPLGDPDRARPRLHGRRAQHRPRRAVPRRRGVPVRHRRRARARARGRRPHDRHRQAGRDHARAAGGLRRRDPRALRALPRVARRRRRQRPGDARRRGSAPSATGSRLRGRLDGRHTAIRRDPARRHGRRRHDAHRRGEAARRARPRRARRAHDRGRLPGVEPQGAAAVRAARRASAASTPRSSPSA